MWKAIKFLIGFFAIAGVGLMYGAFQEVMEEKMYSVISIQYPDTEAKIISIKETPASKCEKWREDYFQASTGKCPNCTVLMNKCTSEYPQEYVGIFEKKKIHVSYIYKPYRFPEVTIPEGLPEGSFSQLCELEKSSLETSVCIN